MTGIFGDRVMQSKALVLVGAASVAFMAQPALASSTTPALPQAAPAPALPAPGSAAVASFYDNWRNPLIWFRSGADSPAATQLVSILRRSALDGLAEGPQLASQAEAAIGRAQGGSPSDIAQADRLLSTMWVQYAQKLKTPAPVMEYADARLAPKVEPPHQILLNAMRAPDLGAHINAVARVNPLYAQLRDAAWAAQQASGNAAPDPRLVATLGRARVLPAKGRYLVVDVATQRLSMYVDGQLQDSMKVIVGKPAYATPLVASTISYGTFNPYWNVPADVIKRTTAPLVIKRGVSYLKSSRFEVASDWTSTATAVDATTIDWKAVAAGEKEVRIRQLPGADNMMGAMKFSFPNQYGIYLHDTPLKQLFAKERRTLSLGCIRLEDAPRLARWLLQGPIPPLQGPAPEQHVQLPQGVPIYVTYLTAHAETGQLTYADDVYGLDGRTEAKVASAGN